MAVLEARPLFLYTGNWEWSQPWMFFRSGFYVGLVAVIALAVATWRSRRVDHLLILCFTIANYLATLGQNRFGYYLVPSTAVVISVAGAQSSIGAACRTRIIPRRRRRPLPFQREIAVIAVAGLIVAPNLVPAAITTTRAGGMPTIGSRRCNGCARTRRSRSHRRLLLRALREANPPAASAS